MPCPGGLGWCARCALCQAEMLQAQGDADGAIRLYAEVDWLCREYKDARALQISLICQAQILAMLAALDDAGTLPGLGNRLVKDTVAHTFLLGSWVGHAEILVERGQRAEGRALAEGAYQCAVRYKFPPFTEKIAQIVQELGGRI